MLGRDSAPSAPAPQIAEALGLAEGAMEQARATGELAQVGLDNARNLIGPLVLGGVPAYEGSFVPFGSRYTHEYALSVAGRVASFGGRLVLASEIKQATMGQGRTAHDDTVAKLFQFGAAHRLARIGRDQIITAENAVYGAIAERAAGRLIHVLPWLARGAMSVVRASWSDKEDTIRVLARGSRHVLTQKTALSFASSLKDI